MTQMAQAERASFVLATRKLEMIVALVVVVLDQATKAMVRPALALHDSIEIIPGYVDFTRVHNTGAAFGMLNGVDLPFAGVVANDQLHLDAALVAEPVRGHRTLGKKVQREGIEKAQ